MSTNPESLPTLIGQRWGDLSPEVRAGLPTRTVLLLPRTGVRAHRYEDGTWHNSYNGALWTVIPPRCVIESLPTPAAVAEAEGAAGGPEVQGGDCDKCVCGDDFDPEMRSCECRCHDAARDAAGIWFDGNDRRDTVPLDPATMIPAYMPDGWNGDCDGHLSGGDVGWATETWHKGDYDRAGEIAKVAHDIEADDDATSPTDPHPSPPECRGCSGDLAGLIDAVCGACRKGVGEAFSPDGAALIEALIAGGFPTAPDGTSWGRLPLAELMRCAAAHMAGTRLRAERAEATPTPARDVVGEERVADIPRYLNIAIANATRAFERGDMGALATINEWIQPLVDAAIAWHRRTVARETRAGLQDARASNAAAQEAMLTQLEEAHEALAAGSGRKSKP